jgi:hypothetical protein
MKFCILLVLCALAGNAVALDREAFTFTSYDLNAQIEPEQQRLGVRGKITLRNDSASPQKHAVLQISSTLSWRSIQVDGKPVQFVTQPYQSDIDHTGALSEAIVSLPREIPPKGIVDLEVGYEGTIPLDATRLIRTGGSKQSAERADWDQIGQVFTAVRGVGYVAWYPVAAEAASLSEDDELDATLGRWKTREQHSGMKISFTRVKPASDSSTLLVCNGTASSTGGGNDQFVTTTCSFQPLGFTVPTFLIGNYQTLKGQSATIYYLPAHKSGAEDYALAADLVLPFVAEWFGQPREKIEVVDVASARKSPYESGRMLLASLENILAQQAQLDVVRQFVHVAFASPRQWIYEGLAYFGQALYRERQNGREAALNYLEMQRPTLVEAEEESGRSQSTGAGRNLGSASPPLVSTFDDLFYGIKAPYVWWMLRDMVGDDALKKAVAAYRPDEDNEPTYMQHLIEAEGKRDLGWFFDDWVYNDRGLPDFRVASVHPRANAQGGYLVTITVENMGGAGAEVPVTLRMDKGEITERVIVRGKSTGTVRIEAPSEPREVVVNDGSVPETDLENNGFKIQ